MSRDESRTDFRVVVGEGSSTFTAVCLGSVDERGGAEESARKAFGHALSGGGEPSQPARDIVAESDAWRIRFKVGSGVLTDWTFEHDGWIYVVGTLCWAPDGEAEVIERSRAILDTWRWASVGS